MARHDHQLHEGESLTTAARGRLTLVFANLDAYGRFDAEDPTASRFVDEDLNRIWDLETLESGRRSSELRRARLLRPIFETADVLLDLHSMLPIADVVTRSALERKESRGGHTRDDYPNTDPAFAKINVVSRVRGGELQLEHQPLPQPPDELKEILEAAS